MTSNELMTFTFKHAHESKLWRACHDIRVITIDGEPWFVAADVCRVLELVNYGNAYRRLLADEKTNVRRRDVGMGHGRDATLISESGLYKLIMRSDKPEALAFQDWVTREVLPSIRKNSGYILGQEKLATGDMTEEELLARAVQTANSIIQRQREKLARQSALIDRKIARIDVQTYQGLRGEYLSKSDRGRLACRAILLTNQAGLGV